MLPSGVTMQSEQTIFRKDVLVNLGVLIVGLGSLYLAVKVWGPEEMRAFVESAGPWAPLAIIAAKTSTIVFAPLNGSFIYPLAGTLFGFWKGFALVAIGDMLGATIAFFVSRRFGRAAVDKMLGSNTGLLRHILETIGTVRGFFITRFLLLTTQDIMAYAAGLSRIPYLPFIVIQATASAIPAAVMTYLGESLLENPSAGGIGLIFLGSSIIGVISVVGFLWFNRKLLFEEKEETKPPDSA